MPISYYEDEEHVQTMQTCAIIRVAKHLNLSLLPKQKQNYPTGYTIHFQNIVKYEQ